MARANKLELLIASLRQKPGRLQGDVYKPAGSNRLITWQSNKSLFHYFFTKKTKIKHRVRFTDFFSSSWPIPHYTGMSAVGDVLSHLEMMTKLISPNVSVSNINHNNNNNRTFLGGKSVLIPQSSFQRPRCTSAVYQMKTTWSERTNFDAHQGKLMRITAASTNLS